MKAETLAASLRPWLEGAGVALLYLLPLAADYLSPAKRDFYHQLLPITTLTRGLFLDVVLLTLIAGAALAAMNRVHAGLKDLLWLPFIFITVWIVSRDGASWIGDAASRERLLRWVPYLPFFGILLAALLLLLSKNSYRRAVRAIAVLFAGAGIALLIVVMPRLLIACFSHMPREHAEFQHASRHVRRPDELRIIWVLFDELSYKQTFERPNAAAELPAFHQLARESTSFSQLRPVGYATEKVVPALLLGHPVADVMGDAEGRMRWRPTENGAWQTFDPQQTIFATAQHRGWNTGVAGWYNPYCRILQSVLDRCYWTFNQPVAGELFSHLSSRQTSLQNALYGLPLAAHLDSLLRRQPPNQAHREDYQNLLHQGEAFIQDPNLRFVFVHLPVPHPPGIFTTNGAGPADDQDYLGNLKLADQALDQLRSTIAQTPAASKTVLIVSSDHSWRIPMWRGHDSWTSAEEQASDGGIFDQRPVLIVHYPAARHGSAATVVDQPQSAMILHELLKQMIFGKLRCPQELANFLRQRQIGVAAEK